MRVAQNICILERGTFEDCLLGLWDCQLQHRIVWRLSPILNSRSCTGNFTPELTLVDLLI